MCGQETKARESPLVPPPWVEGGPFLAAVGLSEAAVVTHCWDFGEMASPGRARLNTGRAWPLPPRVPETRQFCTRSPGDSHRHSHPESCGPFCLIGSSPRKEPLVAPDARCHSCPLVPCHHAEALLCVSPPGLEPGEWGLLRLGCPARVSAHRGPATPPGLAHSAPSSPSSSLQNRVSGTQVQPVLGEAPGQA